MPQMAPMPWLILFLLFSFTLLIFIMKMYFSITPIYLKPTISPTSSYLSLNWKW